MPVKRLLVALLATALLAGCSASADSSSDFKGDQARVAQAIEDLEKAAGDTDLKGICDDILTEKLRDALAKAKGGRCTEAVEDVIDDSNPPFLLTVKSVKIGSPPTTATANVEQGTDADDRVTVTLQKDGPGWRIDGIQRR